ARMNGQCAAILQVSDRLNTHRRLLQVIGDQGALDLTDTAYRMYSKDGTLVDEGTGLGSGEFPGLADPAASSDAFAELIAAQWRRLLDRGPAAPTPVETEAQVLACCLACQLSARTGEAESPRKLLQMHGVG